MFPEITRDDVFRLETRRLWLRWPCAGDAMALAAMASRKDVAEMTVHVVHPYGEDRALRQIRDWRELNAEGHGLALMITGHGEDRAACGVVALEPEDGSARLSVVLGPDRWGQGLATEAVQALVDATFALSNLRAVEACVRVVNPAARRVLEHCGFAYEATLLRSAPAHGGMLPCDCFRLDKKAWTSLKQWRMPTVRNAIRQSVATPTPSVDAACG